MKIKIFSLSLKLDKTVNGSAPQLRGFFASKWNEYTDLHNHVADKFRYRYPLVQYKIFSGTPTIIGINEGGTVLSEICNSYNEIRLQQETYNVLERTIEITEQPFGIADKIHKYTFLTPWFALNQKNTKIYNNMNSYGQQKELLRKTLIGNILSMSSSMGYTVPTKIKCDLDVTAKKGWLKEIPIIVYNGDFYCNFMIPDNLGLGKSVSRGFGAVKQITS